MRGFHLIMLLNVYYPNLRKNLMTFIFVGIVIQKIFMRILRKENENY